MLFLWRNLSFFFFFQAKTRDLPFICIAVNLSRMSYQKLGFKFIKRFYIYNNFDKLSSLPVGAALDEDMKGLGAADAHQANPQHHQLQFLEYLQYIN
jgi:hypothetical protein